MEDLSLIDVSAEDDFLLDLASPPQHPDPPPRAAAPGASMVVRADLEQPAAGCPQAAASVLDPGGATDQGPERTESPKKRKPKGAVNLRKSLAWDSAFFTGEGVLDTEELGIVNSTFRKSQGSRLLPGIAEEMRRSSESTTSTIESESFGLESLDTELFDNVRASIHRTLGKPDKAPGVTAASSKNSKAAAKAPLVTARKGLDRIAQAQSKIRPPVPTRNGCVGNNQRPQATPKEPTAARVMAVSRAAEVKPSSRPPRALPRVATMRAPTNTASISGISDKRSSTGGVVNRQIVGNSANTSASMPSRPGWGSRTSSTSKSGALSSAAITSSHSAPMGTMPGAKTRSPTLIGKSRAQRIPFRSSSRTDTSKVDPARASKSNIPTRSHGEGASPLISPCSSVDSMSSVISGVSTASTIGKASHTSETFSTRSSSLSPSTRNSNDHPPTTKPRPLTVTEGTPCDNMKSNVDISTQGNGFKPSGLRRPTPKIGYFDAEKSVEQKAARVQLQPTKVLFSPLDTANPRISSTPKKNPAFPAFDFQEIQSMAVAASQTKASPSLPLKVAQIEVNPSKMAEHEASRSKALTLLPLRVAQAEEDLSKVADHEASQTEALPSLHLKVARTEVEPSEVMLDEASQTKSSPALPLRVAQTEVKPSEVTEHRAFQTEALSALPLRVAQTEAEPSKVTEHEASQIEASPLLPLRVTETEVEPSKMTENEASQTEVSPLLPLRVLQAEAKASKVHEASQTRTSPSLPLRVAQNEVDQSKAMEYEASQTEASPFLPPGVAQPEVEPSKVMEHEASQTKAPPSLPLIVAQTELESSKVLDHEAHMCETGPLAAVDISEETIPAFHQITQTSGDASPSKVELSSCTWGQQESDSMAVPPEDSNTSRTNVSLSLPHGVAKMEVETLDVIHSEAHMCETGRLVALDIAEDSIPGLHQNTETIGDASPSTVELSSSILGQQEWETTAAPQMESSPSESKVSPSLPTEVTQVEVERLEAIDDESCMPQACPVFAAADTAKENIPALHQNIQPNPLKKNILASHDNIQAEGDMTPVKGTVLASHPNVQAIGEMTPVTLLTQKLSSISIGAANVQATAEMTPVTLLTQKLSSISIEEANVEATPLTLLAQKMSSISLRDATN